MRADSGYRPKSLGLPPDCHIALVSTCLGREFSWQIALPLQVLAVLPFVGQVSCLVCTMAMPTHYRCHMLAFVRAKRVSVDLSLVTHISATVRIYVVTFGDDAAAMKWLHDNMAWCMGSTLHVASGGRVGLALRQHFQRQEQTGAGHEPGRRLSPPWGPDGATMWHWHASRAKNAATWRHRRTWLHSMLFVALLVCRIQQWHCMSIEGVVPTTQTIILNNRLQPQTRAIIHMRPCHYTDTSAGHLHP